MHPFLKSRNNLALYLSLWVVLAALLVSAAVSAPALGRECIEVVSAGGGYAFWQAVGEGANGPLTSHPVWAGPPRK